MDNLALQAALPPGPPLTLKQKQDWNQFVDYIDKVGYKGSPLLDNKDKKLGSQLMDEYRKINPNFSLTYDNVPDVQQGLLDYRNGVIDDYKKGKVSVPGIKSPDEIMPGLSPADGWLGSKTSSYKFPGATMTQNINGVQKTTNYGLNTAAYDAAMAKLTPQKP